MFSVDTVFDIKYTNTVTSLSRAARDGDLEKIKKLIAKGCLPQNPDNRGWTAMHYCAAANQIDSLKLILKLKSSNKKYLVNLKTWENDTPLLLALKNPSPSQEMVKILLKAGASVNQGTLADFFPIHAACSKKGNLNLVKLLVSQGANVDVQESFYGFTPLIFSVWEARDEEIIKYMVKKSNLETLRANHRIAFVGACYFNFTEAVKMFINRKGLLANYCIFVPPIAFAGYWKNLELVKFLLDSGAKVNVKCKSVRHLGITNLYDTLLDLNEYLPIHASVKNLEIFKLFLKLTEPELLMEIKPKSCSFPLFVMMYASDVEAFETVLQSNLPEDLKTISCRDLINFLINVPEMREEAAKKFTQIFKYNFYFEPENVFQNFACSMSEEELKQCSRFLLLLSQMGISSADEFSNKNYVVDCLKNGVTDLSENDAELVKTICNVLMQPVLSLKQLCRITVRRNIISQVRSRWMAVQMVQDSILPESLKKFLFFETLN